MRAANALLILAWGYDGWSLFTIFALVTGAGFLKKASGWLAVALFAFQTAVIVTRFLGDSAHAPFWGFSEVMNWITWVALFFAILSEARAKTPLCLGAVLALPLAGGLAWAHGYRPFGRIPAELPPALHSPMLYVHFAFGTVAYGALACAASLGLWAYLRHLGRSTKIRGFLELETQGGFCLALGFYFLTLTLISGAVWNFLATGSYWSWSPKETGTLVLWVFVGLILHRRRIAGANPRSTSVLILSLFLLLALSLAANFLIPGNHPYGA